MQEFHQTGPRQGPRLKSLQDSARKAVEDSGGNHLEGRHPHLLVAGGACEPMAPVRPISPIETAQLPCS